jgi:hypothetical protein
MDDFINNNDIIDNIYFSDLMLENNPNYLTRLGYDRDALEIQLWCTNHCPHCQCVVSYFNDTHNANMESNISKCDFEIIWITMDFRINAQLFRVKQAIHRQLYHRFGGGGEEYLFLMAQEIIGELLYKLIEV